MAITLKQSANPAVTGTGSPWCAAATWETDAVESTVATGGSNTTAQAAATLGSAEDDAVIYKIVYDADADGYDGASGDWTVRLDVTANDTQTWTECYVCRVNSSGTSQETLASATGLGISLNSTGVKNSGTMNQASATTLAAGDQIFIIIVVDSDNAHGNSQVTLRVDPTDGITAPGAQVVAEWEHPAAGSIYRFYGDGTESGSTALAAQDTDITAGVDGGDDIGVNTPFQVRFQINNTGAASGSEQFEIEFSVDGGAWTTMGTATTAAVSIAASASITDNEATTDRLTGGQGTFTAGEARDLGNTTEAITVTNGNHTEVLWSIQVNSAQVYRTQTIDLRVVDDTGGTLKNWSASTDQARITIGGTLEHTPTGVYQLQADGTESAGTIIQTQDRDRFIVGSTPVADFALDAIVGVRFQVEMATTWATHTAAVMGLGLQHSLNGGAWTNTTTATTVVRITDSASITNNEVATDRMTGETASGGFESLNVFDTVNTGDAGSFAQNNYGQVMFMVVCRSADLSIGDVVKVRLRYADDDSQMAGWSEATDAVEIVVEAETEHPATGSVWRFYADGTESGSTALGAGQDTNITAGSGQDVELDSPFGIRFQIDNTGPAGVIQPSEEDYKLQYSKNSGAWTDVNASSSNVRSAASGSLTDGASTTDRMTGGAGTKDGGEVDEVDGLVTGIGMDRGDHSECLFSIQVRSADTANGDTLDLRLVFSDGTLLKNWSSSTDVARVTVSSGTAGEVTETVSARIALAGEVTEPASARIALQGEATEPASARIALSNEATELASANIALQGQATEATSTRIEVESEATEPVSARIALQGEATEPASTNIALQGTSTEPTSANIALVGESTEPTSAEIALAGEVTEPASARIALQGEATETTSARIALQGEATETTSVRISTAATGEVTEATSARIALQGEATESATARIALQSEATESASARIALSNETTETASARLALQGEATEPTSVRISTSATGEVTEAASARIALQGQATESASANIALAGEVTEPTSVRLALTGEATEAASARLEVAGIVTDDASVRIEVGNEGRVTEPTSVRVAIHGEATEPASARLEVFSEVTEPVSANIALQGDSTAATSLRAALASETSEPADVRVALLGESTALTSANLALQGDSTAPTSTDIALVGDMAESVSLQLSVAGQIVDDVSTLMQVFGAATEAGSVRIVSSGAVGDLGAVAEIGGELDSLVEGELDSFIEGASASEILG